MENINNSNIDFVIVGAGLYGATCARILTDVGYKCLIIDKRNHIGGNCHSIKKDFYDVHVYGPHIFHTSSEEVINFVTKYSTFIPYKQNTLAYDGNKMYNLPFNMHTFNQLFGITTPSEAKAIIDNETKEAYNELKDKNDLESTAKKLAGKTIYETLIKGYTEKQWNKKCSMLPGHIIKRIPLRYSYDNDYFDDTFCGIPEDGYDSLVLNIIEGNSNDGKQHDQVMYMLETNFLDNKSFWINVAKKGIIYCGPVDELMDYELGELEWRSLKFTNSTYTYDGTNGQGTSIINYVSNDVPYTRTIEHMYFNKHKWQNVIKNINSFESTITCEYPDNYFKGKERYYPIEDEKNVGLYKHYCNLVSETYPKIILGGRLGLYKYNDMDDTILLAMNSCIKLQIRYETGH